MTSKIKMAAIVGGLCTGSHWRDKHLAMFAVKNTEENSGSGETYKLSSDVVAYIFALLKKS